MKLLKTLLVLCLALVCLSTRVSAAPVSISITVRMNTLSRMEQQLCACVKQMLQRIRMQRIQRMINAIVKDVLSADPFDQRRSQAAPLGVGPGMPIFWRPRMRLIAAIPVVRQGSTMLAPAMDEEAIKGLNLQADQKGEPALQEDASDDDAVRSRSTSVA